MRVVILLLLLSLFSGCTHISVSDRSLLSAEKKGKATSELQDFPIHLNVEIQCYSSTGAPTMGGVTINTTCSNKARAFVIKKVFEDNGLRIIPATDSTEPYLIVKTKKINGFVESATGLFNLMTFGVLPMYSYTDYMVSYKSEKDRLDISKSVRISSTTSWFSLLLSNPENLSEDEIERRAEENLIRATLDKAKLRNR